MRKRGAEPLAHIFGTSYLAVVVFKLERCQEAIPLTYTDKIRYNVDTHHEAWFFIASSKRFWGAR